MKTLSETIIACRRCPRLVEYRETVPFRRAFCHEKGWRKPVPGFGDPKAWLLILGLAPSVEGANRTGRIFTGDGSAKFLIKMLFDAGLASQPTSISKDDSLQLTGCYLTAAVKCVPPKHQPLPQERLNCFSYFEHELLLLKNLKAILALGKMAFDTYQTFLISQNVLSKRTRFGHGQILHTSGWPTLFGSYHPSPQNTQTGTLTEEMFLSVLKTIRASVRLTTLAPSEL